MEDILDVETEMTSRLSGLQKRLDKHAMHEISKDVGKIQELIKANLQRSKVIQVEERFYDATTLKGTFDLNISTTYYFRIKSRSPRITLWSFSSTNHESPIFCTST